MSLMELFKLPKYTYSPIQAGWVFCAFELFGMSCERTELMQAPLIGPRERIYQWHETGKFLDSPVQSLLRHSKTLLPSKRC